MLFPSPSREILHLQAGQKLFKALPLLPQKQMWESSTISHPVNLASLFEQIRVLHS